MLDINLGLSETMGLSIIIIFIGKYLVKKVSFLDKFCIPYPIVGGLIFAVIRLLGYSMNWFEFTFDETLKNYFMICFFTTIGFSASLAVLKKGGKQVLIFLAVAVVLVFLQNITSIGIALGLGESGLLGMATGSIPMTGGHGTSAAFGPLLEEAGLNAGTTIAIAAATFGLVSGSLIGGPIGSFLIKKHDLKPKDAKDDEFAPVDDNPEGHKLDGEKLALAFFQVALAVGIGYYVSLAIGSININGKPLVVPVYIGSMLVAAVMRNIFRDGTKTEIKMPEVDSLGSIFLAIFLVQAIMGLKLWELADLALPLIIILIAQVTLMIFYAIFVTFRAMGKDYDAAVLAAGNCGFSLGATPNGVANMVALTDKFGPSNKAFFILPIVGCLFVDFCNSAVITFFLNIVS